MKQTSPCFHLFEYRLCAAEGLIAEVPPYDVPTGLAALNLSAYVNTIHTVCETYLEDLGKFAIKESYKKFSESRGIPHIYWCLILNLGSKVEFYQANILGPRTLKTSLADAFISAKEKYCSQLDSNNGVKTKDQRSIFGPIGFYLEDFDHVLSQYFNGLGEYRGVHAHRSGIQHKKIKAAWVADIARLRRMTLEFDQFVCGRIDAEFF